MIGLAVALLLSVTPAMAQAPTDAQIATIRSSCRQDYMRHCSDVPRGGKPALDCLRANQSTLSTACGKAVAAIP